MSINSISTQYQHMSSTQGTAGNGGSVQISYADDVLTFAEADGDVYTINAKALSDKEIEQLGRSLGAEIVKGSSSSQAVDGEDDEDNYDGEINKLTDDASSKQSEVKQLDGEIKKIFTETLDEQEKITTEAYESIDDLFSSSFAELLKAKQAGEAVNTAEFQNKVKSGTSDIYEAWSKDIDSVFDNLKIADPKIQRMAALLGEIGEITTQVKDLELKKFSASSEDVDGLPSFDSEDNIFTRDFSVADSDLNLSFEEANSQTFALATSSEIYNTKLEGHREQYEMISGFKSLDASIMADHVEYATYVADNAEELLAKVSGENEEAEGANAEDQEAQAEEDQESYAMAA